MPRTRREPGSISEKPWTIGANSRTALRGNKFDAACRADGGATLEAQARELAEVLLADHQAIVRRRQTGATATRCRDRLPPGRDPGAAYSAPSGGRPDHRCAQCGAARLRSSSFEFEPLPAMVAGCSTRRTKALCDAATETASRARRVQTRGRA